jgi:hypothetical protein
MNMMPANDSEELPLFGTPSVDRVREPGESVAVSSDKGGTRFGKYIVYVDESGDHAMQSIDEQYPVFVLAFCVFHKDHYSQSVVPALEAFKFKHFGHDQIVLHENEIRKEKGAFRIFPTREHKNRFMDDLTSIIEENNFILISCVIDKRRLKEQQEPPPNPYHIALRFCLETLFEFLEEKDEQKNLTHVVVEQRGKKEDDELELEFRRICDGLNAREKNLPFDILFADKKVMSSGLQLADLVARPIGLHILREGQQNRAFDVLKTKFFCEGGRENVGNNYKNWGLKIHPPQKSERPR